ncbi:MAG: hypothetical protein P0Y55_10660 [Candidatus Cohnella colombiensis]|uniref:Uncharacterized protein n=1 Tax=Candidatus Cohnella colombiensis TaxID=3121368 RepID=A0AA95EXF0_9BACL|nr:MAG: hypothetical protein P0Y55_10660 [Cohnella sp.]
MEQLISFITNNIVFVVIAIGLIYRLFFRKSPLEGQRPNRMPDYSGQNSPIPSHPTQTHPSQTHQPQQTQRSKKPPAPREQTIRTDVRHERPHPERVTLIPTTEVEDAYTLAEHRESGDKERSHVGQSQASVGRLRQEDLARAVMWAEILGPPRARRPHRR